MRSTILILFIFVSSLLCAFHVSAEPALPQGDFSDLRRTDHSDVLEVVNPHTILLADGRIIRLSGVEIPDYRPDGSGEWAVTARDILQDLLIGQRVTVYQTKTKDRGRLNRMGHHLAHLERADNKAWAQGVLVSLGLARVQTTQNTPHMAEQLYALEDRAREDGLGLWSDDAFVVLTPEATAPHIGSFAIVEGTIKSVSIKQNRIYMNFGGNWRDDFTVSIAPPDKRKFSKANIDPLGWSGKVVRVRGHLKSINGPYIEIDHPEAILLLEHEETPTPQEKTLPGSKLPAP